MHFRRRALLCATFAASLLTKPKLLAAIRDHVLAKGEVIGGGSH